MSTISWGKYYLSLSLSLSARHSILFSAWTHSPSHKRLKRGVQRAEKTKGEEKEWKKKGKNDVSHLGRSCCIVLADRCLSRACAMLSQHCLAALPVVVSTFGFHLLPDTRHPSTRLEHHLCTTCLLCGLFPLSNHSYSDTLVRIALAPLSFPLSLSLSLSLLPLTSSSIFHVFSPLSLHVATPSASTAWFSTSFQPRTHTVSAHGVRPFTDVASARGFVIVYFDACLAGIN